MDSSFNFSKFKYFILIIACSFVFKVHSGEVASAKESISVASFNIQFVGHFKKKRNDILAKILKDYDLVFVQELVAPPKNITFNGNLIKSDKESKLFFQEMKKQGFKYVLSEEDTGSGISNHLNTSATEWWVAFYKPEYVTLAEHLSTKFLASDRSNNDYFERVPYAFSFKFGGKNDAVFISTHLQPGDSYSDIHRRQTEIAKIYEFIPKNDDVEKDFIILGNMNIKNCDELISFTPPGFLSMNHDCKATNTAKKDKPYDHVLYQPIYSGDELQHGNNFQVVNLIEAVEPYWDKEETFPGVPYVHNKFRQ